MHTRNGTDIPVSNDLWVFSFVDYAFKSQDAFLSVYEKTDTKTGLVAVLVVLVVSAAIYISSCLEPVVRYITAF